VDSRRHFIAGRIGGYDAAVLRRSPVLGACLLVLVSIDGCRSAEPDPWLRKDAWRRCASAIDAWPGQPSPGCEALHMCANEASLTGAQEARLQQMLAADGCEMP
jgi:hypothetical protein